MRSVTRSLLAAIAVAAVVSIPAAFGAAKAAAPAESAVQAPAGDAGRFVGTYSLVVTERKEAGGAWAATPDFNSNGYIIYSNTGQMAVHIQPKVRQRLSNPPKPEEAQAALRGYVAYFGTYTVDGAGRFVVHHRVGQINPGGAVDAKRYYDFVTTPQGRERLILTPAPNGDGPKDQATSRLVWERQEMAPLSAEQKKFVGFWKLLYTDTYRMKDGKMVFHGNGTTPGGRNTARAGTSYIIYTDSGHMMVHLMDREGRTKWAGAQATPDEALRAFQSYSGYFGRFVTYENQSPQYLIHSQQGATNPATYSDQQRFYQFTGDVLRLGGPPRLNDAGELEGGHLYWQKMKMGEK
ncbi:MAG: lipocalin-like domain-containing protein [Acidobacteria bacterium]|nr:lipocalin-like domain-containing protein [Acidobacteriota bacterium]